MILFAALPFPLYAAASSPSRYADTRLDAATGKFRCIYCDKEFGRGDVCRKHILHCIKKDTEAVVPELRRGRKPKACEACFASKASCDKAHPCSRCLPRQLPCRARDLADDVSKAALPSAPDNNTPASSQSAVASPRSTASNTNAADESMPWIKNLINPRATSMLEPMANDTNVVTERIPDMSFLSNDPNGDREPQASADVPDLMELYPWNYATMLDDAMFNFDGTEDINMLSLDDDDVDALFPAVSSFTPSSGERGMEDTSLHLVNALHDLHNELRASDPTYSEAFHPHAVRAALSATNLKRFAATFFRLSHVHFPIVHIPSFRCTSSRSLLLSLVVQGAFRSPPLDDAALVIVYLLAINNSVSSRRQSRVRRIPEIAWAVRHLDHMSVRHMPDEDWQLFIYRETCIRELTSVATWTAVADWHQCGMFRCMPIMATVELNCNHPCTTAVWDAADAAEFELVRPREQRHHNAYKSPSSSSFPASAQSNLREFIDVLMADKWNRAEHCPRDSYNIHDLTTAIVAHSSEQRHHHCRHHVHDARYSSGSATRLGRWQELWNDLTGELDTAAPMKTGMARHSNETCHLTRKIVEASINKPKHPFFQKVGHKTVTELYSFLIHGEA
ncbi:hypothetical protein LLEC1_05300 [Akanthomyces lecanii]|uniref:Zn(2)-C6 fungal-type domain-containing protein n=1 Tax=Cordyceps confragosa TaxID=2714763 RepID=A0A179I2N2_CORDF|nr:hypothetical protein LLEC1_05300 [Akanthomyces lecanii]